MTDDEHSRIRHDVVDDDVDLISLTKHHPMLDELDDTNMGMGIGMSMRGMNEKEWNHTDVEASTSMYHNYSAGFGAFSAYHQPQPYGNPSFLSSPQFGYDPNIPFDEHELFDDPDHVAAVADVLNTNDS